MRRDNSSPARSPVNIIVGRRFFRGPERFAKAAARVIVLEIRRVMKSDNVNCVGVFRVCCHVVTDVGVAVFRHDQSVALPVFGEHFFQVFDVGRVAASFIPDANVLDGARYFLKRKKRRRKRGRAIREGAVKGTREGYTWGRFNQTSGSYFVSVCVCVCVAASNTHTRISSGR